MRARCYRGIMNMDFHPKTSHRISKEKPQKQILLFIIYLFIINRIGTM
jgi:hypothetical protein